MFLLAAAFVGLAVLGGNTYSAASNVQGDINAWSATNPGQDVPVIVQAKGDVDEVAAAITRAGGTVKRQFHIIPAVQAEVPSDGLGSLAKNPAVGWISLDAPVNAR